MLKRVFLFWVPEQLFKFPNNICVTVTVKYVSSCSVFSEIQLQVRWNELCVRSADWHGWSWRPGTQSRRFWKRRRSQCVSTHFLSLRACPLTPQKPPEVAGLFVPSRPRVPLETWKWAKSFLSTSVNISSGSLKSPRIHPGWGGRRSTCVSETEPERRFSFNMEGSERQTWIFWGLWKLSSCQHIEAVFSSQTPEVPRTHQTLSVRGKQRIQK